MNKRYIITIIEKVTETKKRGKTWELGAGKTPAEYGYTPEIEKEVDIEREVFKQNVDALDITAVIRAINGL